MGDEGSDAALCLDERVFFHLFTVPPFLSLFRRLCRRVVGGVSPALYSGANSKAAWSALGARLSVWRQNIHNVLTTLSAGQQQQMMAAGQDDGEE